MKEIFTKPIFIAVLALGVGFCAGNLFPVLRAKTLYGNQIQNRSFDQTNRVMKDGLRQGPMMGDRDSQQVGMMGGFGGPISGEVVSSDSTSVTIKASDDTIKKITISDTTKVYKNSEVGLSGLTAGAKVTVFGAGMGNGTTGIESIIIDWPQITRSAQD